MHYQDKQILTEKLGNNIFAWDERSVKCDQSPTLTIPSLINGTLDDVKIGEDIVFEEMEDDKLRSCMGLKNFVKLGSLENDDKQGTQGGLGRETVGAVSVIATKEAILPLCSDTRLLRASQGQEQQNATESERESFSLPNSFGTFSTKSTSGIVSKNPEIIIFDNHNHALYFWCEAIQKGIIDPGFELIHIDEHSDLWDNDNHLDLERAVQDSQYAWNFTNLSCNVGNYILPAIECGLVDNIVRIENEYQIDAYMNYIPNGNSVLNLDLDIFAPELDHIPEDKKIQIIKNMMEKVKYVTIATSPYFIEQGVAIAKLHELLKK